MDTPLRNLIPQTTPSSASRRLASEAAKVAGGLGPRRPSWSVGRNRSASIRDRKDGGKCAKDEMTKERRDALQSALYSHEDELDRLELMRFAPFLETLLQVERKAGIHVDRPVDIVFSAPLASSTRTPEVRAVCVTREAVHLLERSATSSVTSARVGNYKVLHTFNINDLVTIIESKKDVNSVCLDFRSLTGARGDKRKTVLPALPDPSYILFPFRDPDPGKDVGKKKSCHSICEKDEFVAVLYFRFWPQEPACAPKGVLAISELLSLRTADDAQRAISHAVRKEQLATTLREYKAVDLIHAESGDKLGIAQDMEVARALKAEGDKKIIVSMNIQNLNRSGSAKANLVLILTDRALHYNDRDQKHRILRRVELQDVVGIVFEDNSRKKNDEEKRWDVLVRLDLANDRSRDFSSDMLFRCELKHHRELLVRCIQSAYEDLVIDKLPVEAGHNIKWGKRGKLEAWLSSLRGGQRKQLLDRRTEESLRWLIYLFKYQLYSFITILSDAVPREELHFMGISIVSLCEAGGTTEKLLTEVVNFEMDDNQDVATIFRGNNLAASILRVYVGHSVDEYLKLVLIKPLKAFVERNPTVEVSDRIVDRKEANRNMIHLWEWCDRLYDRITDQQQVEAMPHEMRRVIGIISQSCTKRGLDPVPYVGGYVMLRVFCPAITMPQGHNLLGEQHHHRARKLVLIARILQFLANKTLVSEGREPNLAYAINWWLRKMGGSHREYSQPPEYRYYGGDSAHRITWDVYIKMLVDKKLEAREEPEPVLHTFREVEAMVQEPDFSGGWDDTRILAGLHKVLTKYTEQLLCLLWTETGIHKHRLGELEAELATLEEEEEEEEEEEAESELVSPSACSVVSQYLSPPPAHGSPFSKFPKSPLYASKEAREKREQFYVRRASLWAHSPAALSPRDDDGDSAFSHASPPDRSGSEGRGRRSGHASAAFLKRSGLTLKGQPRKQRGNRSPPPAITVPDDTSTSASERTKFREKLEYLAYLNDLLAVRDTEVQGLQKEQDELRSAIDAFES